MIQFFILMLLFIPIGTFFYFCFAIVLDDIAVIRQGTISDFDEEAKKISIL